MNAVHTTIGGYQWLFGPNRGVSEDAFELQVKIMQLSNDEPQSMILDKQKLLQELYEIFRECSEVNWDGYGAKATNLSFFSEALLFLKTLPSTLPKPEIAVDPDGEIAFEWYSARSQRVFSVSVGRNNELTYAGLFGISKTSGTEYFGDELPEKIIENIHRVFL